MSKLSIIIPSRNERFLPQTVADLLSKGGDIEVIAILDGYWPDPPLKEDNRLIQLHRGRPYGMRAGINAGAAIATGEYLMKLDGHCMFGENFDEILKADCEDNWISVPTRYSLDAEKWKRKAKHPINYLRVDVPKPENNYEINVKEWSEKNHDKSLEGVLIDDIFTFQGSCWFMRRDYFHQLELMDEVNYGSFRKEPQEITFKAWLSGGRVIRNKKTWYAHLHKGKQYGRGYSYGRRDHQKGDLYLLNWLIDAAWDKQTIPFRWMIDKFNMPYWDNFDWDAMQKFIRERQT